MKKNFKSLRAFGKEKLIIPKQKSFIQAKKLHKIGNLNKGKNSFHVFDLKDKLDDITKLVNTNELSDQIVDISNEKLQLNLVQSEQALLKSSETREELEKYLELTSNSIISSKLIVLIFRINLNLKS